MPPPPSPHSSYGTLHGVGVGPGDPKLLTLQAVETLRAVDVIFHVVGPRSRESISLKIVGSLADCRDKCEALVFSMSTDTKERAASVKQAALRVVELLREGKSCAFTTIGDPLIYSTFGYLQREVRAELPEAQINVIPGITAFQAAAARSGEVLVEDEEILTVVPRWIQDEKHIEAVRSADTVVALKTYRDRNAALEQIQNHLAPEAVLYAARVGQADELLVSDPERIREQAIDYLSLLIARRRGTDA